MIKCFAEVIFAKGHRNYISFTCFTIAYAFSFIVFYEWKTSDIIILFINCDDPINPITTRIIIWIRVNFISPERKNEFIFYVNKFEVCSYESILTEKEFSFGRSARACRFKVWKWGFAYLVNANQQLETIKKWNNEPRTSKQLVVLLLVII